MNESFKKIIDEYKTVPPAKKLLINALKEIKPDKKNWGGFGFILEYLHLFFQLALAFMKKQ